MNLHFEAFRKPIRQAERHEPPTDIRIPPSMLVDERLHYMCLELKELREINATLARQHYKILEREELEMMEKYQPELYKEIMKKKEI